MNGSLLPAWVFLFLATAGGVTAQDGSSFLLGPPEENGPVPVSVGFFLSDINDIDEGKQRFEVEGVVTLKWQDPRMAFDPEAAGVPEKVFQGPYQSSELATGWWPQVVLANESGGYLRQGVLLRQGHDGRMTYMEEMNATVEMRAELRRFPFDRETFEMVFEVLGFDQNQIRLIPDSSTTGSPARGISVSEWRLEGLHALEVDQHRKFLDGAEQVQSAVVISLDVARKPGFMLRVIALPMILLVALSWSVFWMDRESLGDRMDISFVGILTVVAYQILVSATLPKIPYFTLMGAFVYISLFTMAASVLVNLIVGRFDGTGRRELGNQVDHTCRWAFPAAYLALILFSVGYFFIRYG